MTTVGTGTTLDGRFTLGMLLGAGGMGEVYRATDAQTGGEVAVKVLHAESSAAIRARFMREARLASQLRHPHIVPVLSYARGGSQQLYLVMELVEGVPLSTLMSTLPAAQIVALLLQVLEALAYVHARNVLHRDIKPDNILVARDSAGELTARLTDFGIAGMTDHDDGTRLTKEGSMIGTPHYMSPEQASGELYIGPTADLYAIGVMVYEAFAGRLPFEGAPLTILLKKLNEEAPEPGDLEAWPENLWRTTKRLLARSSAKRPRSSADVIAALGSHATAATVSIERWETMCSARPVPTLQQPRSHDAAAMAATSAGEAGTPGDGLWGRVEDRARLMALAGEAEAGQLKGALVRGVVGAGKSALVTHVAVELAESGRFARLEAAFSPAGGGLRLLVERALGTLGRSPNDVESVVGAFLRRHGAFDARELNALVRFLRPNIEPGLEPGAGPGPYGLVLRVIRLLARRGPIVLVLEDIQHEPRDVAGLLETAAFESGYEPLPLLVLATSRVGADTQLLRRLSSLTRPAGVVTTLELEGLSTEAMAKGLRQRFRMPHLVAVDIAKRSGGNPLFAELLATAGATLPSAGSAGPGVLTTGSRGLPQQLRGLMLEHLHAQLQDRVDAAELQVVCDRLALLGSPVDVELLEELCGDLAGDFDDAIDSLIHLDVLAEDAADDTVWFLRPLLEEAILAGLTGRKVRKLHRRAAELREASGRGDREAHAIARHLALAEDHPAATQWWLRGMRWELAAGDGHRAVHCARQALHHMPSDDIQRSEVNFRLAKLLHELGQSQEAAELLEPLVTEGAQGEPWVLIEALALQYRLLDEAARYDEKMAVMGKLEALAEHAGPAGLRAAERARLFFLNTTMQVDESAQLAEALLQADPERPDRRYILERWCWALNFLHAMGRGELNEEAVARLEAMENAILEEESLEEGEVLLPLAGLMYFFRPYDEMKQRCLDAKETARRMGRPGIVLKILHWEGLLAIIWSRWHELPAVQEETQGLMELWGSGEVVFAHALNAFMFAIATHGDVASSVVTLEKAKRAIEGAGILVPAMGWINNTHALWAARKDAPDQVAQHLEDLGHIGLLGFGYPSDLATELKRRLRGMLVDHAHHARFVTAAEGWLAIADKHHAHMFPKRPPLGD